MVKVQSTVVVGAIAGAVLGGLTSFLFFTADGHRVRRRLEAALDEFEAQFGRFRGSLERTVRFASQGRSLISELVGEGPSDFTHPTTH